MERPDEIRTGMRLFGRSWDNFVITLSSLYLSAYLGFLPSQAPKRLQLDALRLQRYDFTPIYTPGTNPGSHTVMRVPAISTRRQSNRNRIRKRIGHNNRSATDDRAVHRIKVIVSADSLMVIQQIQRDWPKQKRMCRRGSLTN